MVSSNIKTILLVEDDQLLSKMYKTKFENEGYSVLTAENGVDGLSVATKEAVDFAVLDIMMPQMSGIDMLEKLRQDPKKRDLPVIMLTNLTAKEEEEKARKLGAKEYIIKANLTPGELVDKIRGYLN